MYAWTEASPRVILYCRPEGAERKHRGSTGTRGGRLFQAEGTARAKSLQWEHAKYYLRC